MLAISNKYIAVIWAAWLALTFGILGLPTVPFPRLLFWLSALVIGATLVPVVHRIRPAHIPHEAYLLLAFFLWCLLASLLDGHAISPASHFNRYIRLVLQNVILMFAISSVIMHTRRPDLFLTGFAVAAFFLILGYFQDPRTLLQFDAYADTQRADLPNYLGNLAVIAMISTLGLFDVWSRSRIKTVVACAFMVPDASG